MKLFILFLFFSINALAANRQDLKSNLVGIGLNDTSDKVLEFNAASGTARAKLRSNISTSKLQFTNDGITYKDLGSGSGGGGYNLLSANSDFESNVTTGWVVSGATAVRTLYPVQGSDNKYYALVTTTQSNGYYESVSQTVTSFLANGDIQNQALIMPVSGTWSIQTLSGTTVIASQTLTVSSDFQKSPLIFTPAGASQTIIKQRFTALVSSSILAIDNTYLGETVNLKNGAVVGPWQSYTIGCSGTWNSNVTYSCKKRQVGENIQVQMKISVLGLPATGDLNVNLPDGAVIDTNKLVSNLSGVNYLKGFASILDSGTRVYSAGLIYNNTTSVRVQVFGQSVTNIDYTSNVTPTVPMTFASGDSVDLEFEVPIVGLSGSSTTFDSRCPNDISCENNFSALVNSAGVVSNENGDLDWINGNCSIGATGLYTCNFSTGVFSTAPNCSAIPLNNPGAGNDSVNNNIAALSSSAISVYSKQGATGLNVAFYLTCDRSGDAVTKRTIEGFMSKNTTHSGNGIARDFWITFGKSTGSIFSPTACDTSPCQIYKQDGAATQVVRNSSGNYDITLAAGTYSDINTCNFNYLSSVANVVTCVGTVTSNTNIRVACFNTTSGATLDAPVAVQCKGYR